MPDASTRPGPSAAGWMKRARPRPLAAAPAGRRRRPTGSTRCGTASDITAASTVNAGGDDERRRVAVLAEHGLADHRADAEAAEHGDGEVARRLGPPVGRREVGDERGRADEQGGLADAGDAAQREQRSAGCRRWRTAAPARPAISDAADHHARAGRSARRAGRSSAGRRWRRWRTPTTLSPTPSSPAPSSSSMNRGSSGTSMPT